MQEGQERKTFLGLKKLLDESEIEDKRAETRRLRVLRIIGTTMLVAGACAVGVVVYLTFGEPDLPWLENEQFAWLKWEELQCANPWDNAQLSLEAYVADKGAVVLEKGYVLGTATVRCSACDCPSGRTLYIKTTKEKAHLLTDFTPEEPPLGLVTEIDEMGGRILYALGEDLYMRNVSEGSATLLVDLPQKTNRPLSQIAINKDGTRLAFIAYHPQKADAYARGAESEPPAADRSGVIMIYDIQSSRWHTALGIDAWARGGLVWGTDEDSIYYYEKEGLYRYIIANQKEELVASAILPRGELSDGMTQLIVREDGLTARTKENDESVLIHISTTSATSKLARANAAQFLYDAEGTLWYARGNAIYRLPPHGAEEKVAEVGSSGEIVEISKQGDSIVAIHRITGSDNLVRITSLPQKIEVLKAASHMRQLTPLACGTITYTSLVPTQSWEVHVMSANGTADHSILTGVTQIRELPEGAYRSYEEAKRSIDQLLEKDITVNAPTQGMKVGDKLIVTGQARSPYGKLTILLREYGAEGRILAESVVKVGSFTKTPFHEETEYSTTWATEGLVQVYWTDPRDNSLQGLVAIPITF